MIQNNNFYNSPSPRTEEQNNSNYSSSNEHQAHFPSPLISPYPTFDSMSLTPPREWSFLSEAKTDISQLIASLHIFNDSKMTDANRPYSTIEHQENSSSDRELYTMLPNLNPFDDELYANEFDSKWNENSNLENMVAPERIKKDKKLNNVGIFNKERQFKSLRQ